MKHWKFASVYINQAWYDDVVISVDEKGIIQAIHFSDDHFNEETQTLDQWLMPGFINAHSHAFQFAMAGQTENINQHNTADNFWSWRQKMYEIALSISPDEMEEIAFHLYKHMLQHGYTNVVEFHYLHHDKNGKPYANRSEMAERLIAAAKRAGIAITIVPILYQQCDLKNKATEKQRRFLCETFESYDLLIDAVKKSLQYYSRASLGVGIHSIRAVKPETIVEFCQQFNERLPFHIHLAEQMAEVNQCLDVLKTRPVAWFLENINVDDRYNFVHATHLDENEIKTLAASKANVVLCPSTEGNLGDGFFPLVEFMKQGGNWSIGTDSHIGVSPMEELRWLSYGQRLIHQQRNLLCQQKVGQSGDIAFQYARQNGLAACGQWENCDFGVGQYFDGVVLNNKHYLLANSTKENRLSTLIYACDQQVISKVIVNGYFQVQKN